jgi:hypothetical protein
VRIRLALCLCGLALGPLAACRLPDKHPGLDDAGAGVDAADHGDARDPDAAIDAPADTSVPDTTPPSLVEMTPADGGSVWLQAPIRLRFDEPLAGPGGTTVTARIGNTAIPAQLAFEPPQTLSIQLAASARGVGALELEVGLAVDDLAGNTLTMPLTATLQVPPWHAPPIDRGAATGAPVVTTAVRGTLAAAWIVGGSGSRRAVAAELDGAWRGLGSPLGTGDVTSVAISYDTDGSHLIAWVDGGAVHVARWSSPSWTLLASPGMANHVALATPPMGAPIIALFGSTVRTYELAGASWQQLGPTLDVPAAITWEPVLVAPAASRPIVGWIDTTNQLRVHRLDASWTALSPLAVTSGSRMSLAARGQAIAIAWDQWAGSFGVLAAIASSGATSWTRLGRPLDVDIAGDARAPAIALDASGNPLVAWNELVETNQRGVLARWSGSAWTIVGGITWLPSPAARPTATRLAIDSSGAPIVATSSNSDVHVARFNGPASPAAGMTQRPALNGCSFSIASPPALLSQTGCFTMPAAGKPEAHAGLIPFDVNSELWTDGARKRRWIGLPAGQSMSLASNGSWTAPVGTFLVKEFALETTPGNPATRKSVETRFFVNDAQLGWQGVSYRWNTAGTDADLLAGDSPVVGTWQLDNGTQHPHVYPSRNQCRTCHATAGQGPLLGLRPEQLARWFDYGGVIADQLPTLAALGVGPNTTPPAFTAPHDPSATAERRMRGYMATNCAHCHNPNLVSIKDLRFATPLANTRLCESIVPGSPSDSVVYQRVTTRPGMPPIGTLRVDPLAQELLGTWISGMTSCP